MLLRGGRPREAIDTLKISVWSRDTPAARLALAEAYVAARDYAAARTEVQAALAADPGNAAARGAACEPPAAVGGSVRAQKRARMSATNPCQMKDFTRSS
jgi:Tfp pilus assembly protein PilF